MLWDGESLRDGVDIHPGAFFDRLKSLKTLHTSSQPSSQEFKPLFQQMIVAAVLDVDVNTEASQVSELIRVKFNPSRLERAGVSPVVGTQVGPGTVGISFFFRWKKFK